MHAHFAEGQQALRQLLHQPVKRMTHAHRNLAIMRSMRGVSLTDRQDCSDTNTSVHRHKQACDATSSSIVTPLLIAVDSEEADSEQAEVSASRVPSS